MSYIVVDVVDVESDGPIPQKYSMVCFGAVVVEPSLNQTFYGKTKPISDLYEAEALEVSGFSRQEHESFDEPQTVMSNFAIWLNEHSKGRPIFISDNPAFDWQWINWYFHTYLGRNPFGFSARRIGDLYCGMKMDAGLNNERKKIYRKTKHNHNPVNDAIGNAEALLAMKEMGLKFPTK
ncbi:MAG: 3'-5' exoribonuclease [Ferruginibacter sp.]